MQDRRAHVVSVLFSQDTESLNFLEWEESVSSFTGEEAWVQQSH